MVSANALGGFGASGFSRALTENVSGFAPGFGTGLGDQRVPGEPLSRLLSTSTSGDGPGLSTSSSSEVERDLDLERDRERDRDRDHVLTGDLFGTLLLWLSSSSSESHFESTKRSTPNVMISERNKNCCQIFFWSVVWEMTGKQNAKKKLS